MKEGQQVNIIKNQYILTQYTTHTILYKDLLETKSTKLYSKMLLVKSSENNFLFTCTLPDYVSHESSKEFWKNTHFENMRAKEFFRT